MLRAYLVDDERLAIERLTRLLERTGRATVVGSSIDPASGLLAVRSADLDVVFLDIQMPGMNGFEFLERLGRDIPIIFTTAYDHYALQAFSANSIDYLLKPIDEGRLGQALDKLARLAPRPAADIRALAREVALQLKRVPHIDRIASRVGERTTLIELARVTHFFSKGKLTFAVAGGRERVVDQTLNELEQRLDPRRFARIHRSTIVNLAFVQEIDAWVDGGALVRLKDDKGTELSVARDRVRALRGLLGI